MSSALYHSSQECYDQARPGGGGKRMRKRGASEYITKEHGSSENRDAAEDPPKMSTAAQMARRKIATPKSRAGRSTTPTLPSNPFQSQSQPQPQPQQQQQQSAGFQFGSNTNQSFPPPSQSQSFQFSVPGASSSFTFGQSGNNQPQPVSNPFAGINGNAGSFGSHQVDNADMQDSASSESQSVQPTQSSSVFKFSTTQPTPSTTTNGFSFGQSSSQQQNGAFGGGAFGQQSAQNQNTNTGLFGQSSNAQQNGFTPSFGQNKQDSAPSIFNQPTSSAPPFASFGSNTSSAPAPAPTFSFGPTSANQPTQSQPSESADRPKKLFDFGASQSESSSAPKKPSFSFGQPSGPPPQSEPKDTPKPAFGGFGQSTNSTGPSVFSGFGSSKPADTPTSQSSNFFNRAPESKESTETAEGTGTSEAEQAPKNPFASLFGSSSAKSETSTESAKPAKSPFQFGQSASFAPATSQSSQPSQPISKTSDPSSANKDTTDQPKGFGFDRSSTSSTPKAPAPPPFGGLFNLNKPTTSAQEEPAPSTSQNTSMTAKSLFSFVPQKPAEPSSTSSSNLFNFGNKSTSSAASEKPSASTEESSPPKKRLFQGSSTPDTMAQSALASLTGHIPPTTDPNIKERAHLQPKSTTNVQTSQESVNRAVSTEGPPSIPRFLSGDKYKVYDEVWRLKALNRRFKDSISRLDPENEDFISIVQNYLDHREAIGEGLAGYERKKLAGTKRKAIDVNDLQDDDEQNKRTKSADTFSAPKQPASTVPSPPKPLSSSTGPMFSTNATPKPATSFTPVKTVADTQTSNIFKSMIPGATSSTNAAPFSSTFAPTKSTTPPSSPPKTAAPQPPKFEVPKFGGAAGGSFMSAFASTSAANAKKFQQAAMEKRKAEEFDSDEDDPDDWNRRYNEELRAKKAKIDAVAKSTLHVPAFVPSATPSRSNSPFNFTHPVKSIENGSKSPEPSSLADAGTSKSNAIEVESGEDASGQDSGNSGDDEDDHAEEDEQQDGNDQEEGSSEEESEPIPDIPPENSLFSRITGKTAPSNKPDEPILQPAANNSFKPGLMFGHVGKGTPEQPTYSPITPAFSSTAPKGNFVPATTFNYTPASATSAPLFGSTTLGSSLKDGPIPGEGLFGSRPSTPSNADASKPSAGFSFGSSTSKLGGDNTYKQGTPIKFGASTSDASAPSLEVTAATPPAKENPKPFAGLFGQSTANNSSTNGSSLGFNFGAPSSSSQPAPGFLSAASHLGGTSGVSSRATSPGVTSEAESVATDNTEDYSQEPQTSLMASNNGEENEDVIFESKAIVSRLYKDSEIPEKSKLQKGWNKMGSGVMKLLKDKNSGKTRIVFRAEPGANVILNTRLITGGSYKSQAAGKSGAITFPVATDDGMQTWMIRVKTLEAAEEAAKAMEANKKN